jgi:uncharacterized membrane protein YkvI
MSGRTPYTAIKVAATYAGTIMGAGFASGQELNQFFIVYGQLGLAGLAVAGGLFAWLGVYILELGSRLNARAYPPLLYHVCGRKLGSFFDYVVALFLFSVLTVMLAGAGTLARDAFDIPYTAGILAMATLLIISSLKGLYGITVINLIITPLLAAVTFSIVLYSLTYHQGETLSLSPSYSPGILRAPHWLLSACLYLSYNLVMSCAVLAPLGATVKQPSVRIAGGILGGFLITLLAGMVFFAVRIHYPQILSQEIPMLYIASVQHPLHELAYLCIFAAAMFTTALAGLFGCAGKLQSLTSWSFYPCLLLPITAALLFSQIGFTILINCLFPLFGYITLLFTIRLLYLSFFSR